MNKITIIIDNEGNVKHLEVDGVKGSGCKVLTDGLEKALGKVTSSTLKSDYYKKPDIGDKAIIGR